MATRFSAPALLTLLFAPWGSPIAHAAPIDDVAPEPSVRDRAREIVRSDKEFLEKVEPPEPSALAPRDTAPLVKPDRAPAPRIKPDRAPAPRERLMPPSTEQARRFLDEYLTAAEGESPEEELAFFADELNYFDSGRVSRKFVDKDQRAYYRRWPDRQFTLIAEPSIQPVSDRSVLVRYRVRYALRRGQETASGQTENILRVKRTDAGLKITSIQERKLLRKKARLNRR